MNFVRVGAPIVCRAPDSPHYDTRCCPFVMAIVLVDHRAQLLGSLRDKTQVADALSEFIHCVILLPQRLEIHFVISVLPPVPKVTPRWVGKVPQNILISDGHTATKLIEHVGATSLYAKVGFPQSSPKVT